MKKSKQKEKRKASKVPAKLVPGDGHRHKRDFEQLLDDAIFGVKKK